MASDLLKTSSGLQGPDNGPWCLPSKPGQACKVLTQVLFLSSRPHWPPRSLCHVAPQRLQRGTLDLGDWLRLQPGTVRQRRCPAGSRFSAPTFLDQRALRCLHHHAKPEEKTLQSQKKLKRQRLHARRIIRQTLRVARATVRGGGDLYWEWPLRCRAWKLRLMRRLEQWLGRKGKTVFKVRVDGCQYGLKNPATGNYLQKSWLLLTTDARLQQVSRVCSREHRRQFEHEPIQGQALTSSTAFYPQGLVDAILSSWA